jgi:hypothetical protein
MTGMSATTDSDAIDAWSRRAQDANGFGDAARIPDYRRSFAMLMQVRPGATPAQRYAKAVEVGKRIRWDLDRDVIRGRAFDYAQKFLPDALSFSDRLAFLSGDERRFFSQVQGRSYANIFGLVERFIGAKILEQSRRHWLGDQVALEALVRFTDEELKHQAMFRRLEQMMDAGMPAGYRFLPDPDDVARAVLAKSTWSVLALTAMIELFTQSHYRASIDTDPSLSPLFKDVFLHHWREESQHAILDELEWQAEDARIDDAARDAAVDDLIALAGAVDGILQAQSAADAAYFVANRGRASTDDEARAIGATILAAYRHQYIVSGVTEPRFVELLGAMITAQQHARIAQALGPLIA